jgi:hypothetical protein
MRMMSSNASSKTRADRRTSPERRRAGDNRRAHDRFAPGKKSNDRRQNERRAPKT